MLDSDEHTSENANIESRFFLAERLGTAPVVILRSENRMVKAFRPSSRPNDNISTHHHHHHHYYYYTRLNSELCSHNLPSQHFQNIFVDLPGFSNPSIITGELTVGYETNLRNNIERKRSKYAVLIKDQMKHFKTVKFVNLSVSALGVFDQESLAFIEMLKELNVDINHKKYMLRKVINIAIRSTYYIFAAETRNGQIQI